MPRRQTDREDLLAEGVNLPQRGRITSPLGDRVWVVGWRNETALSIFDDVDPVFQFNTSGQLRRVFLDGQKIAAHDGKLTQLRKNDDTGARLTFQTQTLSLQQHERVQRRLAASLLALQTALRCDEASIETIGLEAEELRHRIQAFCESGTPVTIAASPHANR